MLENKLRKVFTFKWWIFLVLLSSTFVLFLIEDKFKITIECQDMGFCNSGSRPQVADPLWFVLRNCFIFILAMYYFLMLVFYFNNKYKK